MKLACHIFVVALVATVQGQERGSVGDELEHREAFNPQSVRTSISKTEIHQIPVAIVREPTPIQRKTAPVEEKKEDSKPTTDNKLADKIETSQNIEKSKDQSSPGEASKVQSGVGESQKDSSTAAKDDKEKVGTSEITNPKDISNTKPSVQTNIEASKTTSSQQNENQVKNVKPQVDQSRNDEFETNTDIGSNIKEPEQQDDMEVTLQSTKPQLQTNEFRYVSFAPSNSYASSGSGNPDFYLVFDTSSVSSGVGDQLAISLSNIEDKGVNLATSISNEKDRGASFRPTDQNVLFDPNYAVRGVNTFPGPNYDSAGPVRNVNTFSSLNVVPDRNFNTFRAPFIPNFNPVRNFNANSGPGFEFAVPIQEMYPRPSPNYGTPFPNREFNAFPTRNSDVFLTPNNQNDFPGSRNPSNFANPNQPIIHTLSGLKNKNSNKVSTPINQNFNQRNPGQNSNILSKGNNQNEIFSPTQLYIFPVPINANSYHAPNTPGISFTTKNTPNEMSSLPVSNAYDGSGFVPGQNFQYSPDITEPFKIRSQFFRPVINEPFVPQQNYFAPPEMSFTGNINPIHYNKNRNFIDDGPRMFPGRPFTNTAGPLNEFVGTPSGNRGPNAREDFPPFDNFAGDFEGRNPNYFGNFPVDPRFPINDRW